MKRFLYDLKVSELMEICKKHHEDDYCTEDCPLRKFCASFPWNYIDKAFEHNEGVIEV